MNSNLTLEVFPFIELVGYEDETGYCTPVLNHALLIGDSDQPSYVSEISLEQIFEEFIDLNTVNGQWANRETKKPLLAVLNEIKALAEDYIAAIEDLPEESLKNDTAAEVKLAESEVPTVAEVEDSIKTKKSPVKKTTKPAAKKTVKK